MPVSGEFTIDFVPAKEGDYSVKVVATPALLALPVIGVPPVLGESDVMKVAVGKEVPAAFRFSTVNIDGNAIPLSNKDADSGLLLEKTTADFLDIITAFEWTGPQKDIVISIKAGYKDWTGGFSPKTDAFTKAITLPESPETPYSGEVEVIKIPLTDCGGLTDGAVEIVAKIPGEPDYISHIWNVYATKIAEKADIKDFDFVLTKGSYKMGAQVPFTAPYDYKGIAQDGQLTIEIGTGIYPSFNPVYTYPPFPVEFKAAADWEARGLEGNIILPNGLEPGQTYSVRAKLETLTIETQETDTDWSAFDIVPPTELEPPTGETLPAQNITHNSATVFGRLIDTSFWSNVDVYFEWGETIAYGLRSDKYRMYEGEEGQNFYAEITGLKASTVYHFRAVVEAVGLRSEEVGPGYGADVTFTTALPVTPGFTMRVINPPVGANYWRAGCVLGGIYPYMPHSQLLTYTWEWGKAVPGFTMRFFVLTSTEEYGPYLQYNEFDFLLEDSKNYVWDATAREMREE